MTSILGSEAAKAAAEAPDADVTCDAFLGGRVRLWQPRRGYRAGVDPVLLAASVAAAPGQHVLDLGCGVGAAALCLLARVPDARVAGLEIQEAYATLARRNAALNQARFTAYLGDLVQMPDDLRQQSFDHVLMNPPYFEAAQGAGSDDAGREVARRGATPMAAWIDAATRRLAPKGTLTLIQQIARLPDTLSALDGRLGSVHVTPIAGRDGRPASRFLLRAQKGGRAPFQLLPPLALHLGPRHDRDEEDYSPQIANVLRDGAALFPFQVQ